MGNEHILRFWIWVYDPDGTHENHYLESDFTFEPKLTLTNLDDSEIEVPMSYFRYDSKTGADTYFVDIITVGDQAYYGNKWPSDIKESHKIDFGYGAWDFAFSVQDNESNSDELSAIYRIWQTGSFESMRSVFFGSTMSPSDNEVLNTFGYWSTQIKMILFLGAAACSLSQQTRQAGRFLAIGAGILDFIHIALGMCISLSTKDPGALIGLALHTAWKTAMFLIAKKFVIFMNNLRGGNFAGGKSFKLLSWIAKKIPYILLDLSIRQ